MEKHDDDLVCFRILGKPKVTSGSMATDPEVQDSSIFMTRPFLNQFDNPSPLPSHLSLVTCHSSPVISHTSLKLFHFGLRLVIFHIQYWQQNFSIRYSTAESLVEISSQFSFTSRACNSTFGLGI